MLPNSPQPISLFKKFRDERGSIDKSEPTWLKKDGSLGNNRVRSPSEFASPRNMNKDMISPNIDAIPRKSVDQRLRR